MTWDVACLGDLVMDLVPHAAVGGASLYQPCPGGAPGNVAVGLARLGHRPLMMGKVGDEAFGRLILQTLAREGVDTAGVVTDSAVKTRLSVVTLAPDGERSFIFYGDGAADAAVDGADIAPRFIEDSKLLHVGSLLMASPRAAAAQEKALALARANGKPVSVDLNFRPGLWPDMASMTGAGRRLVASAQIVKLDHEELRTLTGIGSSAEAVRSLWHESMRLVAITSGAEGAELFTRHGRLTCHGFRVDAVDTLAAGDAFMAALLSGLIGRGLKVDDDAVLRSILTKACAAGALAATRKGAMETLPTRADIKQFLAFVAANPPA